MAAPNICHHGAARKVGRVPEEYARRAASWLEMPKDCDV